VPGLSAPTQLAREIGVTANQIALAYLLHQRFPVVPILGTSSVEHLREAIGAVDIQLTEEQVTG